MIFGIKRAMAYFWKRYKNLKATPEVGTKHFQNEAENLKWGWKKFSISRFIKTETFEIEMNHNQQQWDNNTMYRN